MIRNRSLVALLLALLLSGCTGGGAVSPLNPKKLSETGGGGVDSTFETVFWTPQTGSAPVSSSLQDVCLLSPKLGWACGTGGMILQFDGKAWKPFPTGLNSIGDLYALSFKDESEGWAVGIRGTIVAFKDGKWSLAESPTTETLYDVVFTSSRRGWAVGTNGTVLSFNGTGWDKVEKIKTTSDLYGLGFYSQGSGWAVGDRGAMLRFDGSAWTDFEATPVSDRLNAVHPVSDVEAWAVGALGTFLRFNGTVWTKVQGPLTQDIYDIYLNGTQDGWASGQDGALMHYDGARWISQKPVTGKPALNALAFLKKNLGFVVGQNGAILKFVPGGERPEGLLRMSLDVTERVVDEPPLWKLSIVVSNEGGKPVADTLVEASLPKGFHPVKPLAPAKDAPTATRTPTPTPAATPGPAVKAPVNAPPWVFNKGKVAWNLGLMEAGVSRTLLVDLTRDAAPKGKSPLAVVHLSADSSGRRIAESGPFHLEAEPPVSPTPTVTQSTPTPP